MSPFGTETAEGQTIKECFPRAFAGAQRVVSERPRVGWMWPMKEILKDATDEHMEVVNAFIEPILQEALRKKEERAKAGIDLDDKESQDDETLLDHLVKQTSGTSPFLTTAVISSGLTMLHFYVSSRPPDPARRDSEHFVGGKGHGNHRRTVATLSWQLTSVIV